MPTIYDTITSTIVAQIEAGAGAWSMPWHKRGARAGLPINASTGKGYQGANILMLWGQAQAMGYSTPTWATYKQWQALGAQVRKGERGTACIKWTEITDKRAANDDQDTQRRCLIGTGFYLFNADQVDGWTGAVPAEDMTDHTGRIERAELIAKATGARITHNGTRAFYRPSTDEVVMPDRFRFTGTATSSPAESYYSTLFHELSHWTGHESRNARNLRGRFGDESYAAEELVAELGAAFICARLGITNEARPDHAQYIASWLKVLKNDNRAIFTAAGAAQKAADFILNRIAAPAAEPQPIALAA